MAPSARVVINRAAMDEFALAIADGLGEVMAETQERALARPIPDDPATRTTIQKTAGWLVLNGNKKVAGDASKPRTLRGRPGIITAAVGFGSPLAHLFERGTAGRYKASGAYSGAIRAQPFLLPSFLTAVQDIVPLVAERVRQRMGK